MAFSWGSVEQREQKQFQNEKQLKSFLLNQQEEVKQRKAQEKQRDLDESRQMYGGSPRQQPLPTQQPQEYSQRSQYTKPQPPIQSSRMQFQPLDIPSSPLLSTLSPHSTFLPSTHTFNTFQNDTPNRSTQDSSFAYLEARLDREQSLRESLETEIRTGKNAMTLLQTRLDHYTSQPQLSQKHADAQESGLVRFEAKKDLERMGDGFARKFEQVGVDQAGIKERIDKTVEVNGKKIRLVMEEIDHLKHHLTSYIAKSSGKDTDSVIYEFQKACDQKFVHLYTSLDLLRQDHTTLSQNEQSLKDLFQQLIKDTATEIMKTTQQQIHLLESSTHASLIENKELTEIRRIENEKILMFVHDQSQTLVAKIMDVKEYGEGFVKSKMVGVEDWITAQQHAATHRESQLKSDFDASLLQLQSTLNHTLSTSSEDTKLKLTSSIKSVQHSVQILEESTLSRLEKVEKVMRAEIEQRIEQQRKYELEVAKLSDQIHAANGRIFELQGTHLADHEKVQNRIETVQSNLKDVLSTLSDDVNQNKLAIVQNGKAVQEMNLTLHTITASEKDNIARQLEKQLVAVNNNIKQLQLSFGDLHTKSAHSTEAIQVLSGNAGAINELKASVCAIMAAVGKIETWKNGIPDRVVSKSAFDAHIATHNQSISEVRHQVADVNAIISTSNILKTVDLVQEFTKLQTKVEDDQSYIQNIVNKLSQSVDESVNIDTFNAFKETTESMLGEVQDLHRLTNSDIDNLETSLKTKIDQAQFLTVNVNVKNLRESLGGLSTWVHDNASKQAKEIHTTLMDVHQGITTRQLNQLKHIEETKEHLERKIEHVVVSMHEQQLKATHFEDNIMQHVQTGDAKSEVKLAGVKSDYMQLVKMNGDRVEEVERHIANLKSTMGAFVSEKIIPLATKNELQVFESGMHLLSSELKQARETQRTAFDKLRSDIDSKSHKQVNVGVGVSSDHEMRMLRDSIHSASTQNDLKYSQYLSTLHEMSDRLKLLELKQSTESIRHLEITPLSARASPLPSAHSITIAAKSAENVRAYARPTTANIYKPDFKIKSTLSLVGSVPGSQVNLGSQRMGVESQSVHQSLASVDENAESKSVSGGERDVEQTEEEQEDDGDDRLGKVFENDRDRQASENVLALPEQEE